MPTMRAVAVARAAATFEAPAAAIWTTISTTIRAAVTATIRAAISSARAVEASASAAVAATIPSAALRPLESRARIAADARGIAANEFFAWSVGVAWSARLSGKEDGIFLDDGFSGFTLSGKGSVGFGFHAGDEFFRTLAGMLLGFVFRIVFRFTRRFVVGIVFCVQTGFGSIDGFLMFAVGFVFGIFARAFGILVLGVFTIFFLVEMVFGLVSLFFLFVEGGAINQSVGVGASLRFLVLGFDDVGGKSGELFVIERGRAIVSGVRGCRLFVMFFGRRGNGLGGFGRSGSRDSLERSGLCRFGFGISEHPVRQAARGTPAHTGTTLRQTNGRTRSGLFEVGLALFGFLFANGLYGSRNGTGAILGERFAR
jgi:hypothetical protein